MKKNTASQCVAIIIVLLFLGTSFVSVSARFIADDQSKSNILNEQRSDVRDIFFDLKMSFFMKLAKFPSLSVCVIDSDEIIWSNGYGFYDLDNRKPATDTTIYNIASITKTVTGTALMQLWEQGFFDLDEDVNKYLPFDLRNPHFPDDPITFRMLLSHSSSINTESGISAFRDWLWSNFSVDPPFEGYPDPWLQEHLIPGGKWYYSERWSSTYRPDDYAMYANVNFEIIAYLIELISGEIFIDYCKNHIFTPLEMFNTSFNLSELDIDKVAIPYHYHDGEYLQINELNYLLGDVTPPGTYWRIHPYPAGGLYSTVSDLSHFFIAHMNSGVWNGVRILEASTVEEMHLIQPPGNIDPYNYYYGLGWLYQEFPFIFNITFSGHTGGSMGVGTMMYYIPSEHIGIIYFVNADTQYEQNFAVSSIASMMIPMILFKKGGISFLSYINI